MRSLGIAGLQLALEESANLAAVAGELRRMKARLPWVQMAVLSELAIHGANTNLAEDMAGPTEAALCDLARETGLWLVPGSLYQRAGGALYNATPVIDPSGTVVARYAKMFPFLPYEAGVTPGGDFVVFNGPGGTRIGISNCYDMWFPETIRTMAAMGAEIVVHPSYTNTIDRDVETAIARANAATNQLFFLDVNAAGAQGNGRSGLYGPGGEVIYQAGQGRDIMAFDVDLAEVRRVRERGWHSLGQVLKSFRDSRVAFPSHSIVGRRSAALEALGSIAVPRHD
jgi:predicted amidohydrolase